MSDPSTINVAIGLGSNLGDPGAQIAAAVARLRAAGGTNLRVSAAYESAPEDCVPGTPWFLNAAVTMHWGGAATSLLTACQQIERDLGRPPEHRRDEARPIDLDLLLFGEAAIESPELTVPHPRLTTRLFVLLPLAEIAPGWPIPGSGWTVQTALEEALVAAGETEGCIRRAGTLPFTTVP